MNIGAVGSIYEYGYRKVPQAKAGATGYSSEPESKAGMEPLEYYKKLCSEFSDVTFRLDDRADFWKGGNES